MQERGKLAFPGHIKMALTEERIGIKDFEKKPHDTGQEEDILIKTIFNKAPK